MGVGIVTGWLAYRSKGSSLCHGSEPCSGLLPWTFRPSVTGELGERVQVADMSAARTLWKSPNFGVSHAWVRI